MATLAVRLIETTPRDQISQAEASYLLAAGLTGCLANGDKDKARVLLETFVNHHEPIRQPPLYLYLLVQ